MKKYQLGSGDWAFYLMIFAFALAFCGTPDLHDALVSQVSCKAK